MTTIRLTIAYDGTDFHGYARQAGLRTVQGTLEDVLSHVTGHDVVIHGSGRTDAGVHARGQVVHWTQEVGPPAERYPYLLRRSLPKDIVAVDAREVPDDFHARFSAIRKTYRYSIQQARTEDIFTKRFAWHIPQPLDLGRMRLASESLLGTHDFTSFCAASTPVEDKVRTVERMEWVERDSYLDCYVTGSGFLQHMVRIITGTLVDIGLGRLSESDVPEILQARDRRLAGQTAPPHGLALWQVDYDNETMRSTCRPLDPRTEL